ncbi:MAG TPA: hybrid sensor histidine kinase/response regulator [Polyangiales bacterium]|nr:hybrid sensor histidine kinase/response regulator [Polyangiales bacterium]
MNESANSLVKCLIVDDLEENLLALEALLRGDDVMLLKAHSGREALELLLQHDVALALLDVQMPEMDGFELAELMRGTERTKHVPIIFITAGTRDQLRVFKGYDAGAVDFLYKPLEPRILTHKARTFFELYRQRQALAETLSLNEQLLAIVSHDLRDPLNVILMSAELLQGTQDPNARKIAQRLSTAGGRMRSILDELFDLARARLGGGIPLTRQPVDLAAIAHKTVAEVHATHPERGIDLRSEGDVHGNWDSGRLERVFANLIGNAVAHGTEERIGVQLRGEADAVHVSVHNGGHVPAEVLPNLFEPFHARKGMRARGQGLGLGLYIAQQIILAHAGTIEVRSTPAEGTTFRFTLPRG